jgi:hypothetical protein
LFGESAKDRRHMPELIRRKPENGCGVLQVLKMSGAQYNCNLVDALRQELMVRQAFHIFRNERGSKQCYLKELRVMTKLDLFSHWLPKSLFYLNFIFLVNTLYFLFPNSKSSTVSRNEKH